MRHHKGQSGTPMSIERKFKRPKGWIHPESELAFEYKCSNGHKRIERERIKGQLPICSNCHMTLGEINRIYYSRKVLVGKISRQKNNYITH